MPELPEVETIVRELRGDATGKVFNGVRVLNSKTVLVNCDLIKGRRIIHVEREGKFIVFLLEGDLRLVIHLRMTGRLMWHVEGGREKYVQAEFFFDDGSVLYFSDVRKFGRVWLLGVDDYRRVTGIDRLGKDALAMSLDYFQELLKQNRGSLKGFLLKQDKISGIGNIYADEICFRSGLHPLFLVENLKCKDSVRVFEAIQYCLCEGIKHCGVSVSDFVGTRGDLGKYQNYLQVYGRSGDCCYRCGGLIEKIFISGRGTSFCGFCQLK